MAQWRILETELVQLQHALANGTNVSASKANKTAAKVVEAPKVTSAKVQVAQHKEVHDAHPGGTAQG